MGGCFSFPLQSGLATSRELKKIMHYPLGLTSQPDLCAISVQVQHSNRVAHRDQDALSIMCESENTFVAVMGRSDHVKTLSRQQFKQVYRVTNALQCSESSSDLRHIVSTR